MAYIGVQPTAGQYRKLDNISASFNGSTTSFTTSVGGTNVTAGTAQQLIVSLGGVIQQPDTDYTVSTNTITFTTAPTSGLDFFAILMGDALNTVTPSDGSVTTAKLAGSLSVGLAAGSVSAPSLFFTGDTNNGIYSPSTDAIAVTTAGSECARIDSSGRLLVGTTASYNVGSPGSALLQSVVTSSIPTGSFTRYTNDNDGAIISLGKSRGTSAGSFTVVQSGDIIGNIRFAGADGTDLETQAASIRCEVDGTPGANDMPGRLVFSTTADGASSPTERMRIDSSGRLLVGTTSSRTIGTAAFNIQTEGASTEAGISSTRYSNNTSGPNFRFVKTRGTTAGSVTAVQSSDSLGTFGWYGTDGTNAINAAAIEAFVDGTPGANDMPGRLVFSTTADGASTVTERMRIANTGELTFAAPSSGYTFNAPSSVTTWRFGALAGNGPYYIVNSGNIGVQLNNNATAWSTSSDERLKENLQTISNGLDKVSSLRACTGKYITDEPGTSRSFLIAQDVQAVLPEAVDAEDPNNLALRYTEVIPLLVAALKESKERIETLEAKVSALESA